MLGHQLWSKVLAVAMDTLLTALVWGLSRCRAPFGPVCFTAGRREGRAKVVLEQGGANHHLAFFLAASETLK